MGTARERRRKPPSGSSEPAIQSCEVRRAAAADAELFVIATGLTQRLARQNDGFALLAVGPEGGWRDALVIPPDHETMLTAVTAADIGARAARTAPTAPRCRGRRDQGRPRRRSGTTVLEAAAAFESAGVAMFIYTDVGRDGTMEGPNVDALLRVASSTALPVIASGGIGNVDDLRTVAHLHNQGIAGAIVGRALYERKLSVAEANFAADEIVEVHAIDCTSLADGVDADWVDLAWGDGSEVGPLNQSQVPQAPAADDAAKASEVQALVRRLQRMDVEVLSYDPEQDAIVPKRITNWFDNGPTEGFLQFTVARPGPFSTPPIFPLSKRTTSVFVAPPLMWATKPTPHASCSWRGSYNPC